jgi:hypothetical protein
MDELGDAIRRHAPGHDAADVSLIPVDQFGEPIGLAFSNPAEKLPLLSRRPVSG